MAPASIASCWRHSKCLPNEEALLGQENPLSSENEEEIHSLISTFAASVDAATMNEVPDGLQCVLDVFSSDGAESCSRMIDRWIDLEHDSEIMIADDVLVSREVEESISTFYIENEEENLLCSEALLPVFSDEAHRAKEAVLNSLTDLFAHNLFLTDEVLCEKAEVLRKHLVSNYEAFHGF